MSCKNNQKKFNIMTALALIFLIYMHYEEIPILMQGIESLKGNLQDQVQFSVNCSGVFRREGILE